jgi:hypothetical protein
MSVSPGGHTLHARLFTPPLDSEVSAAVLILQERELRLREAVKFAQDTQLMSSRTRTSHWTLGHLLQFLLSLLLVAVSSIQN